MLLVEDQEEAMKINDPVLNARKPLKYLFRTALFQNKDNIYDITFHRQKMNSSFEKKIWGNELLLALVY